eukprot:14250885-Alexandrium_andersonii.AAC.1
MPDVPAVSSLASAAEFLWDSFTTPQRCALCRGLLLEPWDCVQLLGSDSAAPAVILSRACSVARASMTSRRGC